MRGHSRGIDQASIGGSKVPPEPGSRASDFAMYHGLANLEALKLRVSEIERLVVARALVSGAERL